MGRRYANLVCKKADIDMNKRAGELTEDEVIILHCCFTDIVKPTVSGHPWDQKKWPLKRDVRLWEVKNVVFVCS